MKTERKLLTLIALLPLIFALIISISLSSCDSDRDSSNTSKTVSDKTSAAISAALDESDMVSSDEGSGLESETVSMTESERQAYLDEINSILNEIREG